MMIEKRINIQASITSVYEAFYNFSHWQKALSDIVSVDVHYDDGKHQEFTMVVKRPEGNETVKGFRFCESNKRIELFQTTPPPLFHKMTGIWDFFANGKEVTVMATRDFTINNNATDASNETISVNLGNFLQANLNSFKKYIEADNADQSK